MINTNYLASVFTSHAVVEKMKQRRKGHIVFVSSIGGQVCKLNLFISSHQLFLEFY